MNNVMRMWIRDGDETPQGFPLKKLLRGVRSLFGDEHFKVEVFRADGYGFQINSWNSTLEKEECIVVDFLALEKLAEGTEEWFYSLDARISSFSCSVRLGLHDSSALYVEATKTVLTKLEGLFVDVYYSTVPE